MSQEAGDCSLASLVVCEQEAAFFFFLNHIPFLLPYLPLLRTTLLVCSLPWFEIGSHHIAYAGLEIHYSPASASWLLGLQVCTTL